MLKKNQMHELTKVECSLGINDTELSILLTLILFIFPTEKLYIYLSKYNLYTKGDYLSEGSN